MDLPLSYYMGAILLVLATTVKLLAAPRLNSSIRTFPASFFFGHILEFNKNWDTIQDWFVEKSAEFDFKTWGVTCPKLGSFGGHGAGLMLITPEAIKHVLKDEFGSYVKGDNFNAMLNEFLGDGIFASDGERWKRHRKVASNMFSRRLLINSSHIALSQAIKLKNHLADHAEAGSSVDLQQGFYAYTMDTFCYIAFGVELESQKKEHYFTAAFDTIQKHSNDRALNSLWKWCRALQLTAAEREITKCKKQLNTFCHEVISAKRREVQDWKKKSDASNVDTTDHEADLGPDLGPDLISRFLAADENTSNQELRDIVLNFIIAGRDTTAATLSWCMYELLKHPKLMDRAVAEILEKQKSEGCPLTTLDTERLFRIVERELPFTKACANETLRLHPSVPKDLKYATKHDTLPDGTKVEPGMAMFYLPYVMGRNPNLWDEPLTFNPERWLTEEEDADKQSVFKPTQVSDFKFPTFNAGPRLCLGRPLAYVEIVMALMIVLSEFEVTEAENHEYKYTQTIVPSLLNGLKVKVKKRAC